MSWRSDMWAVGTWGPVVRWPGTDFPGTLTEGRSGALREGPSFQKQQRPWTSVPQPMPHTPWCTVSSSLSCWERTCVWGHCRPKGGLSLHRREIKAGKNFSPDLTV